MILYTTTGYILSLLTKSTGNVLIKVPKQKFMAAINSRFILKTCAGYSLRNVNVICFPYNSENITKIIQW